MNAITFKYWSSPILGGVLNLLFQGGGWGGMYLRKIMLVSFLVYSYQLQLGSFWKDQLLLWKKECNTMSLDWKVLGKVEWCDHGEIVWYVQSRSTSTPKKYFKQRESHKCYWNPLSVGCFLNQLSVKLAPVQWLRSTKCCLKVGIPVPYPRPLSQSPWTWSSGVHLQQASQGVLTLCSMRPGGGVAENRRDRRKGRKERRNSYPK